MSHVDQTPSPILEPSHDLQPTRLVLSSTPGSAVLDGVWWPRSGSLHREVPFLDVAVQAATHARIARLSYTVGAWDEDATQVWTPLGLVKVGWFITSLHPRDVDLRLDDNRRIVLRVISAGTSTREGEACLRLAQEARVGSVTPTPRLVAEPGITDGSAALRRVRMIADPVERADAAGRLERSFGRGASEAARMREDALRGPR